MPLTTYALDRFVATKISEFTAAEIEDMSRHTAEQSHWVSNFILNSTLSGAYKYPYQQHTFAFLRRAEISFREHGLARSQTEKYLHEDRSPSRYFLALSHWENLLSSTYLAFSCFKEFAKLGPQDLFTKNDGSPIQRLNMLYNLTKHANDLQYPPESTLAVWLDNSGVCSLQVRLDYAEITSILLPQIAELADRIQNPVGLCGGSAEQGRENRNS